MVEPMGCGEVEGGNSWILDVGEGCETERDAREALRAFRHPDVDPDHPHVFICSSIQFAPHPPFLLTSPHSLDFFRSRADGVPLPHHRFIFLLLCTDTCILIAFPAHVEGSWFPSTFVRYLRYRGDLMAVSPNQKIGHAVTSLLSSFD